MCTQSAWKPPPLCPHTSHPPSIGLPQSFLLHCSGVYPSNAKMDEGLKDMKLTEQEEERRMEEEEERRMEREEERKMEGEEDETRMEEVEMEKGDKIRGENLCPAFSSNDSKAVDLFFNVVPGIEVQYVLYFGTLTPERWKI